VKVKSPSGFEEPMISTLKSDLNPFVDKVYDTPRGNVVGIQEGSGKGVPSIALLAHMDQVGFTVFNIDDRGFIRFRRLGGAVTRAIQGQQIRILTEKRPVLGVIGIKPGHITKPEEANTIPPIEEMYIDVGAKNQREVEEMDVKIGSPIVTNAQPIELGNDMISSPGVDNRAGLTALIATAKILKDVKTPATVYYVGTVEEEVGLRGAEVVLYDLDVDMAIAIDTCPAGWQPDVVMRDLYYEVGMGPAIHIGGFSGTKILMYHHKMRRWLIETAEAEGIPYQSGIMHGETDAFASMQTMGGIPSITMGIPRRYSHSPVEVFDLNDLRSLVKILVVAIKKININFKINRV
jgi:endoglucanase